MAEDSKERSSALSEATWQQAELVRAKAAVYRLDPDLVLAIIDVESSGRPTARRWEHAWKYYFFYREWASRLRIPAEEEYQEQATSWGLMQVMGSVARELGFDGRLPDLCSPELGIEYGLKKLDQLRTHCWEEAEIIAAYNAGSPRKTKGGLFVNQTYVDRVHKRLHALRALA